MPTSCKTNVKMYKYMNIIYLLNKSILVEQVNYNLHSYDAKETGRSHTITPQINYDEKFVLS